MKHVLLMLLTASILTIYSCEKNNCQTQLQGSWLMPHPVNPTYAVDSVIFYKGDSLRESYKLNTGNDSIFYHYYSSYFVSDYCDEIDFNGTNSWDTGSSNHSFNILLISGSDLQFRSKSASDTCQSCIIALHR